MEESDDLFARYLALEMLFLSLVMGLKRSSVGVDIIEEVFDSAAHAQIANVDANKGDWRATRALQIIDELREVAVPKSKPADRPNRG